MKEVINLLSHEMAQALLVIALAVIGVLVKYIIDHSKKDYMAQKEDMNNRGERITKSLENINNNIIELRHDIDELKQTDNNVKKSIKSILVTSMNSRIQELYRRMDNDRIEPSQEEMDTLYSMWNDIENKYDDGYKEVKVRLDRLDKKRLEFISQGI